MTLVSLSDVPVVDADPLQVDLAAATLRTKAKEVSPLMDDHAALWSGARDVYDVDGVADLMARAGAVATVGADLTEAFTAAADALQYLAESLQAAKSRCDALREEIPIHRANVLNYREHEASQWGVPVDGGLESLWGPGQWTTNATLAAECVQARDRINRAVEECVTDLKRIQGVPYAAAALGSAAPFALAAPRASVGAPMVTSQMRHEMFEQRLTVTDNYLSQAVATATTLINTLSTDGLTDQETATLTVILKTLAQDSETGSQVWLNAGGQRTRVFFEELSATLPGKPGEASPGRDLAFAARQSLAAGSEEWDQTQADEFVEGLTRDDSARGVLGLDVVGFLFAEPATALMGAAFTSSMATRLDYAERDSNSWQAGVPLRWQGPVSPLLWEAEHGEGPVDGNNAGVYEPITQVLNTLTHHPKAALDWLTTPDAGNENSSDPSRIEYWYGQRDWSADGFTVAGGLWEKAMLVEGGIASGVENFDNGVLAQQADLLTGLMDALGDEDHPHFAPDALSDEAQESMGRALSTSLPWLMETEISGARRGGRVQFMGVGDEFVAPLINESELTRVWGTVASGSRGLAVLDTAVDNYTNSAIVAAMAQDVTSVTWDRSLRHVAQLTGFHQGSLGGVDQYHAAKADEEFAREVDIVGTVAGVVPIPGVEKVPALVSYMLQSDGAGPVAEVAVELFAELGLDRLEGEIIANWGNSLEASMSQTNGRWAGGWLALEADLIALEESRPDGLHESMGANTVGTWRSDFLGLYEDKYGRALASIGQEDLEKEFEDVIAVEREERRG